MTIHIDGEQDDTQVSIPADDELESVEVDLEDDGSGQQDGQQQQQVDPADDVGEQQPRRSSGRDARGRINQLTAKVRNAETVAQRLARENEELRQQNAGLQRDKTLSDRAALVHYENSVTAKLEKAEKELQDAIASGDPAAQATAQKNLGIVTAEKSQLDNWKAAQPQETLKSQPQEQPKQQQRQPQPTAQMAPETVSFIKRNDWFNPDAADYDEDMHIDARQYATTLERRLKREGRDDEIGGADYFKQIEDYMRREYPDYDFGEEQPKTQPRTTTRSSTPPMTKQRTGVVGAGNSGSANGGSSGKSATRVTLSGDERRLAHSLAQNGAVLDNGKRITDMRIAERIFAQQKLKQPNGN